MPLKRIGTDADHDGAQLGEVFIGISEAARLFGTKCGTILWVKINYNHVFVAEVRQSDLLAIMSNRGEVGCWIARVKCSHLAILSL